MQIPLSVLGSPAHHQLALETAAKGMVLLQNPKGVLTRVSALHQATAPPLTTGGGLCSRGRATGCSASKTAPPGAQDLRSRRPRQPQAQPHGTQLPHPQQSLAHCAARAVDTTRPDGLRYPPSKITLCIEIPVSVPILRPTSYPTRYPTNAT